MTEKLLKSESFKERNERFLRAITGDYDQQLVFSKNNRNKEKVVEINPTNPMFQEKDLVEKIMGVRGLISQRSFHRLYTDFSAIKKLTHAKNETSVEYETEIDFLEMIEDAAVEQAGCYEFPGLKHYVEMVNYTVYEKMPSINETAEKESRLKAFKIAAWEYLNKGKTKETILDKELNDLFEQAKPILDQAKLQETTLKRVQLTNQLSHLVSDLIEEAKENAEDASMPNQKGNDMSENNEGEGQETPEGALKQQQQQKQQESSENNEKVDTESDQKGEKEQKDASGDGKSEGESNEEEKNDASNSDSGEQQEDTSNSNSDNEQQQQKPSNSTDGNNEKKSKQNAKNPQNSEQTQKTKDQKSTSESMERDVDNRSSQPLNSEQKAIEEERKRQEEIEKIKKELEKEIEEIKEEMEKEAEEKRQSANESSKTTDELQNDVDYGKAHRNARITPLTRFSGDKMTYNRIQQKNRSHTRSLTRRIQNLLKYNLDEKRTGETAGYLTQSELWRKDGKIFSYKKDKNDESDLVIAVLVDESGSMGHGKRSIWAREAAVVLAEVCEQLNIPLAILGHTASFSGPNVQMRHYIGFEKPIAEQKANLSQITSREDNRDGMALKYTGEYLLKQPQKDKLMLVIADGEPAHGYDSYHGAHAIKDCQKTIEEFKKKGITSIGIAIGDGQDEIERIFENFISIPQLEKLPIKLVKILERNIFKK